MEVSIYCFIFADIAFLLVGAEMKHHKQVTNLSTSIIVGNRSTSASCHCQFVKCDHWLLFAEESCPGLQTLLKSEVGLFLLIFMTLGILLE